MTFRLFSVSGLVNSGVGSAGVRAVAWKWVWVWTGCGREPVRLLHRYCGVSVTGVEGTQLEQTQ